MVEIESKGDFISFKTDQGKGNFVILNEKLVSLKYETVFGYFEYIGQLYLDTITYTLNISANSIEDNKNLYNFFKELKPEIENKYCLIKLI